MKIFTGIKELLSFAPAAAKGGRQPQEADLGIIAEAAIVEHEGQILWVGQRKDLPGKTPGLNLNKAIEVDLGGRVVMPSFIECHTHSLFAGNRQQEFEWRMQGVSYQEIAQRGGGIKTTMNATRAADAAELLRLAKIRAMNFARQGVSCLELKSGYGLDFETEIKLLSLAADIPGPEIVRTYLGPHAIPPEFPSSSAYMDFIIERVLPQVASRKLAERADIFVEAGYFSLEDAHRYASEARRLGLRLTGHMDQLSRSGGVAFGIEFKMDSVDHCVFASSKDIQELAKSETVAVLLPSADLYLRWPYPPARSLIDSGACVALSTDFNPGTSPSQDIALVGLLARLEMKMSLPEVLTAWTVGAARALHRLPQMASLEPEKQCNFICLEDGWQGLFLRPGDAGVGETWRQGRLIASAS